MEVHWRTPEIGCTSFSPVTRFRYRNAFAGIGERHAGSVETDVRGTGRWSVEFRYLGSWGNTYMDAYSSEYTTYVGIWKLRWVS